jgi:hypothetical protein
MLLGNIEESVIDDGGMVPTARSGAAAVGQTLYAVGGQIWN